MIKVWTAKISLILIPENKGWKRMYELEEDCPRWFKKYNKYLTPKAGFRWNGADGVVDLLSLAPLYHDWVVGTDDWAGTWAWDDGTPITVKESSGIIAEVYRDENRPYTASRRGRWTYIWQIVKYKLGLTNRGKY